MTASDARHLVAADLHREQARALPARLALSNARDKAAQVLTRMVAGDEPADVGRVAACRAVLELGAHHAHR